MKSLRYISLSNGSSSKQLTASLVFQVDISKCLKDIEFQIKYDFEK